MIELLPAVLAFAVGVLTTVLLMKQRMSNQMAADALKHEREIKQLDDRLREAQAHHGVVPHGGCTHP